MDDETTGNPRRSYLWIAATLTYTVFAVSVTAVILSLSGSELLAHPLVILAVVVLLAVPGFVAASRLSSTRADGGDDPDPPE